MDHGGDEGRCLGFCALTLWLEDEVLLSYMDENIEKYLGGFKILIWISMIISNLKLGLLERSMREGEEVK